MIDLYYWPTPNGWKVSIMLEECGLPYNVIPVNISSGDQFKPEFLAISPNNRMPAIVDHDVPGDPMAIFESGAVLVYLAEKVGQFLPRDLGGRFETLQWVFWQVGGLGPMAGQLSHFVNYAPEPIDYALARYGNEYNRLLGVMDRRLGDREFLAGDYSIADMASWPWVRTHKRLQQSVEEFPHLQRWLATLGERPAVVAGSELGREWWTSGEPDDAAREILFGQTASRIAELASEKSVED